MFFLQALIFIAAAFGLGCLFGCWLKGRTGSQKHHSGAAAAITHEGAARTGTAGELAAPTPHYEPVSSPQPAASLTARPDAAAKAAGPVAAPIVTTTAPARKVTKPKPAKPVAAKAASGPSAAAPSASAAPATAKSPAAKPAAAKPVAAKAAGATPAKAKAEKPAGAKPAKARPVAADVPDNLKQIKGIGPAIEAKLNAIGVKSFAQIAAWTKKEQADFAEQLSFSGRVEREEWVSQAKVLAKGGTTEFAKRVARGEVASSADTKPKRGG